MTDYLLPPFPWYGGKRRYVGKFWGYLGDPQAYVEPFCGSAVTLLKRPPSERPRRRELINDINAWVTNFYRAVQADPCGVAVAMDWPNNSIDQAARQSAFTDELEKSLRADPKAFDVEIAGWWALGQSCSISGGYPDGSLGGQTHSHNYRAANQRHVDRSEWCSKLSGRLRHVQVQCGDWRLSLSKASHMNRSHSVGVLLDPPYDTGRSSTGLYVASDDRRPVAEEARQWAIDNGDDDRYRILLCGFTDEHDMPEGWTLEPLGKLSGNGSKRNQSEAVWVSPYCIRQSEPVEHEQLVAV